MMKIMMKYNSFKEIVTGAPNDTQHQNNAQWVTIGKHDVKIGVYVTSQYDNWLTHRNQQGRGDRSMGILIEFSVFKHQESIYIWYMDCRENEFLVIREVFRQ